MAAVCLPIALACPPKWHDDTHLGARVSTNSCSSWDSEEDTLISHNTLLNSISEVGAALLMSEDLLHENVPVFMDSQEFLQRLLSSKQLPPTYNLDDQIAHDTSATSKPQQPANARPARPPKRKVQSKQAAVPRGKAVALTPEADVESVQMACAAASPAPSSDTGFAGLWVTTQTDSADSLVDIVLTSPASEEHHPIQMLRPCVARHPRLRTATPGLPPRSPPLAGSVTSMGSLTNITELLPAPLSLPLLSTLPPLATTSIQRANSTNSESVMTAGDSDSSGASLHLVPSAVAQVPAASAPAAQAVAVCQLEKGTALLVQPTVARRKRLVVDPIKASKRSRGGM